MSRVFNLPDGSQINGCKNYCLKPCPNYIVTSANTDLSNPKDDAFNTLGQQIKVWIKAIPLESNTSSLRFWYYKQSGNWDLVTCEPEVCAQGVTLTWIQGNDMYTNIGFRVLYGSYKVTELAIMLAEEYDEVDLPTNFNKYYASLLGGGGTA